MKPSKLVTFLLVVLSPLICFPRSESPAPSSDGYLQQKVAILIYSEPTGGNLPDGAEWILAREIRAFEAFVWRHSGKRLYVETVRIQTGRRLKKEEFMDRGPGWGHQPRFSPEIASDLKRSGWSRSQFGAMLVLYEPLPAMETPVAGATYGPKGFSTIPLTEATFAKAGRKYPLHLLLVHEFLHQLEQAFEEATGGPYLFNPDEEDLKRVLRRNYQGSEIEWRILSPALGAWIPR